MVVSVYHDCKTNIKILRNFDRLGTVTLQLYLRKQISIDEQFWASLLFTN
jgi:hypothetical protein